MFFKLLRWVKNRKPINGISDKPLHQDATQSIWHTLIDNDPGLWKNALEMRDSKKKILIASLSSGPSRSPILFMNALLSASLTLRGSNVEVLQCDHALPICLQAEYQVISPKAIEQNELQQILCNDCYKDNINTFSTLGLMNYKLSNFCSLEERKRMKKIVQSLSYNEIKNYQINGVNLGEHAFAATIRYFGKINFMEEPHGQNILMHYLESAMIFYKAMKNLFKKNEYQCVIADHGIYIPHGILAEVCNSCGIDFVGWGVGYRKHSFIFNHEMSHIRTMYNEPTEIWEKQNWDATREQELMRYINGKDKYWLFISEDKNKIPFQEYVKLKKIDLNKPIIGMLTNVIWDAQVFYEARVFEDMITWINKTINYFSKRTDLQLLIRVHPAEAMPMNRQPVVAEIKKAFENLPPNVFIIDAEDTVSTFEAIDHCNAAIIYATTAGIELAAKGKPVIVAGEAWIKNKNISYDPTSEIEYFQLLDKLPFISMLSEEKIIRAKKYAYYFYFNRMIHLSCLSKEDDSFRLNSLEDLLPGVDPGLDVICKSILKKLPFLYS